MKFIYLSLALLLAGSFSFAGGKKKNVNLGHLELAGCATLLSVNPAKMRLGEKINLDFHDRGLAFKYLNGALALTKKGKILFGIGSFLGTRHEKILEQMKVVAEKNKWGKVKLYWMGELKVVPSVHYPFFKINLADERAGYYVKHKKRFHKKTNSVKALSDWLTRSHPWLFAQEASFLSHQTEPKEIYSPVSEFKKLLSDDEIHQYEQGRQHLVQNKVSHVVAMLDVYLGSLKKNQPKDELEAQHQFLKQLLMDPLYLASLALYFELVGIERINVEQVDRALEILKNENLADSVPELEELNRILVAIERGNTHLFETTQVYLLGTVKQK